jgi:hypothetical protein
LLAAPSANWPEFVTLMPPSGVASRTMVLLLTGFALVDFDLARLSFHVPTELSAPNAATAV